MGKRVIVGLLVDDIDEANKYQDILNKMFNSIEDCDDSYFSWESITHQESLYSKLVNYGNSSLLKISGFKVFNLSTLQLEDISITEVKSSEMDSTFLNRDMNIETFETDLSCMGICLNNHYVDRLVYMALLNSSAYPVIHNGKVIKPNKNKYSIDSLNMSILRLRLQICGDFGFSAGIEILIDLDKNKYCVYSLDKFCTGDRTVNDVPSIYNIRIQLSKIDCNLGYVEFIGDYCVRLFDNYIIDNEVKNFIVPSGAKNILFEVGDKDRCTLVLPKDFEGFDFGVTSPIVRGDVRENGGSCLDIAILFSDRTDKGKVRVIAVKIYKAFWWQYNIPDLISLDAIIKTLKIECGVTIDFY
jgi:hypothetical protein